MSRFLMVDIGAGTMDILYFDEESPQHYKAVARSPVLGLAEKAARLPGTLLVTSPYWTIVCVNVPRCPMPPLSTPASAPTPCSSGRWPHGSPTC